MLESRFVAHFEDGHPTHHHNLRPLRVAVTAFDPKATTKVEDAPVKFQMQLGGTTACWLQVWHLGTLDQKAIPLDVYTLRMRHGEPAKDVLLAEIPGCIMQMGTSYEFLAAVPPQPGPGLAEGHVGWLTLDLRGLDGYAFRHDGQPARIRISHDGADDRVVLALRVVPAPNQALKPPKTVPTFPVWNLQHALGSMLAEDPPGLTVGFHVVLFDKNGQPARGNDASFVTYGAWMARMFHAIGLTADDELTIGTMPFSSTQQIFDRVSTLFGWLGPFIGPDIRIKRLFLVTHGDNNPSYFSRNGGGIELHDQNDWLTRDELKDIVPPLRQYLSPDVVVNLCACAVGASTKHVDDFSRFDDVMTKRGGHRKLGLPPDIRGQDSFADELRKLLAEGLPDAAVWAHTSYGDALRNAQLRAFTRAGNADISWLVLGMPNNTAEAYQRSSHWCNRFPENRADSDPAFWSFVSMAMQNPTQLVKELLDG